MEELKVVENVGGEIAKNVPSKTALIIVGGIAIAAVIGGVLIIQHKKKAKKVVVKEIESGEVIELEVEKESEKNDK